MLSLHQELFQISMKICLEVKAGKQNPFTSRRLIVNSMLHNPLPNFDHGNAVALKGKGYLEDAIA